MAFNCLSCESQLECVVLAFEILKVGSELDIVFVFANFSVIVFREYRSRFLMLTEVLWIYTLYSRYYYICTCMYTDAFCLVVGSTIGALDIKLLLSSCCIGCDRFWRFQGDDQTEEVVSASERGLKPNIVLFLSIQSGNMLTEIHFCLSNPAMGQPKYSVNKMEE